MIKMKLGIKALFGAETKKAYSGNMNFLM